MKPHIFVVYIMAQLAPLFKCAHRLEQKKEGVNPTENLRDRELRQKLRQFEAVWQRVDAARDPKAAAEAKGVRLMPRRCCRKRWR